MDLYATRVGRKKVGSYGWHMDRRNSKESTENHRKASSSSIFYFSGLQIAYCNLNAMFYNQNHRKRIKMNQVISIHQDTVDALIYVLKGTKRVRVAGHYPGSKVTLDKASDDIDSHETNSNKDLHLSYYVQK